MTQPTRRLFVVQALAAGCSLAASTGAGATPVDESDETAVALGYRNDTTKVDDRKFPKHTVQERCVDCAFFQGAPTDAWAGCAMFGRKQINANGWCNAWAKKPG